jgi:hypothetical protein
LPGILACVLSPGPLKVVFGLFFAFSPQKNDRNDHHKKYKGNDPHRSLVHEGLLYSESAV